MATNPIKRQGAKQVGRFILAFTIAGILLIVIWTFTASLRAKGEALVAK